MANRYMLDTVNLEHLPATVDLVAGYVDGQWPTFPELIKRYPIERCVSIATMPHNTAMVLDVENGDATPSDVPQWVTEMRVHGLDPVIYTSRVLWPTVVRQCRMRGVKVPKWWCADWTGVDHVVYGSVATQWANGSHIYPGKAAWCDTSTVTSAFPLTKAVTQTQKGSTSMNININQIGSLLRQASAALALLISVTNAVHMPASVRAALVAVSGTLLTVQHYVSGTK